MSRSVLSLAAMLIALGSLGDDCQAVEITWSDFAPDQNFERNLHQPIRGDKDVFKGGAAYNAVSFGHVAGPEVGTDVSINGIDFRRMAANSGGYTRDGITIDEVWATGSIGEQNTGSTSTPFSGLSANYQSILSSNSLRWGGDGNKNYTTPGLQVGQSYRIQAWTNDSKLSDGMNDRTQISLGGELTGQTYLDGTYGFYYGFANSANPYAEGALGRVFNGTFTVDTDGNHQLIAQLGKTLNALSIQAIDSIPDGSIDWGVGAQNITGESDVSTAGDLLYAFNNSSEMHEGESSPNNLTVLNGVPFRDEWTSDADVTGTEGGLAIWHKWNRSSGYGFNPPYNDPGPNPTDGFDHFLHGAKWHNEGDDEGPDQFETLAADNDAAFLQLNDLIPGREYEVQLWAHDSRTTTTERSISLSDTSASLGTAGANEVTLDLSAGPGGAEGELGQYVIGTFTAQSKSQNIYTVAGTSPVLNAFQVRDITEVVGGLPGDFDGNSVVDGFDYLLWQRNPAVGALADWETYYGNSALGAEATAVPEPSSHALLAMASVAWLRRRARI